MKIARGINLPRVFHSKLSRYEKMKILWLGLGLVVIIATYLVLERRESTYKYPGMSNDVLRSEAGDNREFQTVSPANKISSEKLSDVIADEITRKGIASPEVADLVSVSQGACARYEKNVQQGAKTAGWAGEYLASACQGFDATQYKGLQDPAPDFLAISLEGGQSAAAEAALDYLKHPDSVLAALQAAMVIGESGKLPDQASLGLDEEQIARAIASANASAMCAGQNGCAAARVLAAVSCLESSCPSGISYETALRRELTPAELEAADRLRDWLVSLRTAQTRRKQ